jgi:hypothetical protein
MNVFPMVMFSCLMVKKDVYSSRWRFPKKVNKSAGGSAKPPSRARTPVKGISSESPPAISNVDPLVEDENTPAKTEMSSRFSESID